MPVSNPNHAPILFLCTANYYRSRFAEILFNYEAAQRALPWSAASRAIALDLGVNNLGPISKYALLGLQQRGIPPPAEIRFPAQLRTQDLAQAQRVIALDQAEHHPLLLRRFPDWADRVEYWSIPDLHLLGPVDALDRIENRVRALICELQSWPDHLRMDL
ncbi:MAG TPA: hypothetical protein VF498_00645 [Anaerolineales bacterium]